MDQEQSPIGARCYDLHDGARKPEAGKGTANMGGVIQVAINSTIKYKADLRTDKNAARSLTYDFDVVALTPEELVEKLRERCNIACNCFDADGNFHRLAANFKSTWVIGVDVDNDKEITVAGEDNKKKKIKVKCEGDEYLTFEQALTHPIVERFGGIVYTTATHKPEHHKFRILFILADALTDRAQFEKIVRALIFIFKSDDSCKDASRFYYGPGENGQVVLVGHRLTDEGIAGVIEYYDLAHAPREDWKEQRAEDDKKTWAWADDPTNADERRAMYGRLAIETAVRMIDESSGPHGDIHGNRHSARLRAARLLGGYVAGGILQYYEARNALADAVRSNTDDFTYAMKTIDDGLAYGQSSPIRFEDKEREREAYFSSKRQSSQTQTKREPMSENERQERAEFWRRSSNSPEALAADVLGSKSARHLLQLWAEVQFTDEAKVLMIAWEALAQGCEQVDYHYGDLYELLYKCDGSEFEQTEKGRMLKSSCRQKLADRIKRFEAEQESIGITFAYAIPGHLDLNDNPIPSRVTLYSRQIVAEALVMAEDLPGYARARKETRAKAIREIVREKTGVAYIRKPPKKNDRHKKIADGWNRMKGNLDATVARMEERGDSFWSICETAMEFIDSRIVEYIKQKGREEADRPDLPCNDGVGQSKQTTARPGSQPEGDFDLTSKMATSAEDTTDDHAQKSSFVQQVCKNHTKPVPSQAEIELWAITCAKSQAKAETLHWLRENAPDAFDSSKYSQAQDHPSFAAEYDRRFALLFSAALAECPQGISDLEPNAKPKSEAAPEVIADAFSSRDIGHGVTMTEHADGSTVISGGVLSHERRVERWRESMGWQWAAMR
ncbi:MAG TPA: hypothetical protein VJX74_14600, partial [Blastocatellia bacterium]|nr:hypothetical protein [Blastocatellia bacterium]